FAAATAFACANTEGTGPIPPMRLNPIPPAPRRIRSRRDRPQSVIVFRIAGSLATWAPAVLLFSGSSPDFLDALVEPAAQQRAQRDTVGISHTRRHFVDARSRGLQQMDGALDPKSLEIGQRGFPQHVLHAARERPL